MLDLDFDNFQNAKKHLKSRFQGNLDEDPLTP